MLAWAINLGFAGSELVTAEAPYRVVVGQLWHTGSVTAQRFAPGAAAGQTFHTGQTAGQIDGRCG